MVRVDNSARELDQSPILLDMVLLGKVDWLVVAFEERMRRRAQSFEHLVQPGYRMKVHFVGYPCLRIYSLAARKRW